MFNCFARIHRHRDIRLHRNRPTARIYNPISHLLGRIGPQIGDRDTAPAAANRIAMAPPISPPPPVMSATRPAKSSFRSMSGRHFIQFPQPVEHVRRRAIDPSDHARDLLATLRGVGAEP